MVLARARTLLPVFVRAAELPLIPWSLPRNRLEKLLSVTWTTPQGRGDEESESEGDFPTATTGCESGERGATTQNKLPPRRIIHGVTPEVTHPETFPTPTPQPLSTQALVTRSSHLEYNTESFLPSSRAHLNQVASAIGFRLN